MNFLFSSIFWGIVIIFFGLSIIFKAVFNLDVPVFRIVFSIIIIYIGLSMLTGTSGIKNTKNKAVFQEKKLEYQKNVSEYSVIFSKGDLDLTKIILTENKSIEYNVVFGSGELTINSKTPAKITASAAFGETKLPDGNSVSFATTVYKTKAYKEGEKYLDLKVNAVFGGLEIKEK